MYHHSSAFIIDQLFFEGTEMMVAVLKSAAMWNEKSVSKCALKSWKPASHSTELGIDPHSHSPMKHETEDVERSELFPTSG